jgi:hypothetical protein
MTATLNKLEGEPILIVTHEGFLTAENSVEVTERVVHVMEEVGTQLYGIIDLRKATCDLPELFRILAYQSKGARGTLTHEETYVVLVGEHLFIRLFHKLFRERAFGGVVLSVYMSMDEALRATRQRIAADAARAG